MSHSLDPVQECAPVGPRATGRGVFRWVCTSNPFYVLSALLVCLGLWVSFGSQTQAYETWALLSGMAGYTLLLAVTASLLVKFVGVWDDVRTLLLLVVLLFLATSVTFDEQLARNPGRGLLCYLGGLMFAVAVSQEVLSSIGLVLPRWFRLPYYLSLSLFFLYPIVLTPLLDQPRSELLAWALFGFSPAAGLVSLTLLPAIRRGRDYVRDNGSPWPWAWYPWSLFAVLGFGVVARSPLLCWSMHHLERGLAEPFIFGPYFLVPFLCALAILLLEIGLVERHRGVQRLALGLPVGMLVLTLLGHRPEPVYQQFLAQFITRLGGTPLYLSLLVAAAFYAYAALRRVPMATAALSGALLGLAVIVPESLDLRETVSPRPLPILALAVLQLGLGLRGRNAWRCFLGATCLVWAVALVRPEGAGAMPYRGPIAFHLILLATLVIGAAYHDTLGRFFRALGALLVLAASLAMLSGSFDRHGMVPLWIARTYPLVMAGLLAGYGYVLRHRVSLVMAGLIGVLCVLSLGWNGYRLVRRFIPGLDYIVVGMILFAMAVLTSVVKGRALPWTSRVKPASPLNPSP